MLEAHSERIFEYLNEQSRAGKSAITIANELNLKVTDVKKILTGLPNSFVRVGDSLNFTVNRFKKASLFSLRRELQAKLDDDAWTLSWHQNKLNMNYTK